MHKKIARILVTIFMCFIMCFTFTSEAFATSSTEATSTRYLPPSLTSFYVCMAEENSSSNNAVGTILSYFFKEVVDGTSIGYDLSFDQTTAQVNNGGVADLVASTGATKMMTSIPTQSGRTITVGNANQAAVDGTSALVLYLDPKLVTDSKNQFNNTVYKRFEYLVEQSIFILERQGMPTTEANINETLVTLLKTRGIDGEVYFRECPLYLLNGKVAFDSDVSHETLLVIMGYHNTDTDINIFDLYTRFKGLEIDCFNAMINAIEMRQSYGTLGGLKFSINPQIYELMEENHYNADILWEYLAEVIINQENTDLLVIQNS